MPEIQDCYIIVDPMFSADVEGVGDDNRPISEQLVTRLNAKMQTLVDRPDVYVGGLFCSLTPSGNRAEELTNEVAGIRDRWSALLGEKFAEIHDPTRSLTSDDQPQTADEVIQRFIAEAQERGCTFTSNTRFHIVGEMFDSCIVALCNQIPRNPVIAQGSIEIVEQLTDLGVIMERETLPRSSLLRGSPHYAHGNDGYFLDVGGTRIPLTTENS